MAGQTLKSRQQRVMKTWVNLEKSCATVDIRPGAVTTIELGAIFAVDTLATTTTGVRLRIRHGNSYTLPTIDAFVVEQVDGNPDYCASCGPVPCEHHDALLEAATKLDGEAGALVREAVSHSDVRKSTASAPVPATVDDDGYLIFLVTEQRWQQPDTALAPVSLLLDPVDGYAWSETLAVLIPDPTSLTGAVTSQSAQLDVENLTGLGRRVFLLAGPPGTGKSATLAHIAAERRVPYLTVNSPDQVELFRVGLSDGATVLHHSLLVEAVQHPCVVELVDLHRWMDRMDVLDAIEPLLNPSASRLQAYFPIENGAIDIPIHTDAVIAATTNRPSFDFGEKWLERWTVLPFGQLDRNVMVADAIRVGAAHLDTLVKKGVIPPHQHDDAHAEMVAFANLAVDAVIALNSDPLLSSRHSWGSRSIREAVERRVLGQAPNEIAAAVFAGKLPRDPALALHALSRIHTVKGWGRPKVSRLAFGTALTAEQLTAAFAETGGDVE